MTGIIRLVVFFTGAYYAAFEQVFSEAVKQDEIRLYTMTITERKTGPSIFPS